MTTPYDVSTQKLISALAEDLSRKIEQPQWTRFVKTGSQALRIPQQSNWYHLRAASLLRRVYVDGPVGIERFRTVYGGSKNRGAKPKRFVKSGGKITRTLLQSLENLALVDKTPKGRMISAKGRKYVDSVCRGISEGSDKPPAAA